MKYSVICKETTEQMNDKPLDIFQAEQMVLSLNITAQRYCTEGKATYLIMPYDENYKCK